jgi:hypothetical protein
MAEEHKKKKRAHAGHGIKHVHIQHHNDASHTVHHQHEDGKDHDVKHASPDMDSVHDSIQDNLGTPNPGEAEANAGQSGIPVEQEAGAAGAAPAMGPAGM